MFASARPVVGFFLVGLVALSVPLIGRAEVDSDEGKEPSPEGSLVRDVTTYQKEVQNLHDILNGPMAVHHRVKSLHKTLQAVADNHKINIVVNERGLSKEPPSDDRLSAIELRGRTVGEALTELLDAYDLDYYVYEGCITVDAAETVRKRTEIRAYDVGPLLTTEVTASDVASVLPVSGEEIPHPIVMGSVIVVSVNKTGQARVRDFLRKSTPRSIRAEVARRARPQPAKPNGLKDLTWWEGSGADVGEG